MIKEFMIYPENKNFDLCNFLKTNWKNKVKNIYQKNGYVLFRGFKVRNLNDFSLAVKSIHKKISNYQEASTPRDNVKDKIYTSTQISALREIPIHNEMSYASKYPKHLWFYSHKVAKKGGFTTIANSKTIYDQLNKKIKNIFEKKKIMYLRRYGFGFDLSWNKTFNTDSKKKVEKYCKKNKIKFKWEGNKLITWKINNFSIVNKNLNSKIWFNQAHLFHNSNIDSKTRNLIKEILGKDLYLRDAKFGDGKEIPLFFLKHIRKVLEKNSYNIKWKKGDVLLINNLMISHGRRKYTGSRKVFVMMTDDN